ncbi:MAG: hypothetical protein FJY85_19100 [Deltaproteobacteria bacterium]|nr:hypothetical protein [Deltaproteobacteria bacterium]
MAEKDQQSTGLISEMDRSAPSPESGYDIKALEAWLEMEQPAADSCEAEALLPSSEAGARNRVDRIKQSHALLRQFTPKELRILLSLKRNTSSKAWTLREDLVVLTLGLTNREIADLLKDRNKEAVKKRLQLLRSKGLTKRQIEPPAPRPESLPAPRT